MDIDRADIMQNYSIGSVVASMHPSKHWIILMPILYDTIEAGQNKKIRVLLTILPAWFMSCIIIFPPSPPLQG